ncbi:MAG: PQQ-dependent sugar dehydrogenase [Betaproteobacteria bacterium AqS2]|uniref:PQQ-dependent sugar dehydrogenase n=1 Tax=Candidatus Amphirhobacter heronislandensis TaxID=1732024 RepID=A0A930UEW5_9GAMM|nr:PQQ-dependent sugar dehydrogenase [Betaproteobacteria bacterium AqS2]
MLARLNSTICGLLAAAAWASADPATALAKAVLPPGLKIVQLDAGLDRPAGIDVSAAGHLAVGSYGDSLYLYERLPDGNVIRHILSGMRAPTGVAWLGDDLVLTQGSYLIMIAEPLAKLREGRALAPQQLAKINKSSGRRFLKYDGERELLYVGVPSSCNACQVPGEELAGTIIAYDLKAKSSYVHARGLRAPRSLDVHPATGELWATDASAYRHPPVPTPADELNRITAQGLHFGHPHCHGIAGPEGEGSPGCDGYAAPAALLDARSQPHGLHFIRSDALLEPGSALVALRGGWKEKDGGPRAGFEVRQLLLSADGRQILGSKPFITGWLDADERYYARPAGIGETAEGSILITDSANGAIYIVSKDQGNASGQHQDAGGN